MLCPRKCLPINREITVELCAVVLFDQIRQQPLIVGVYPVFLHVGELFCRLLDFLLAQCLLDFPVGTFLLARQLFGSLFFSFLLFFLLLLLLFCFLLLFRFSLCRRLGLRLFLLGFDLLLLLFLSGRLGLRVLFRICRLGLRRFGFCRCRRIFRSLRLTLLC